MRLAARLAASITFPFIPIGRRRPNGPGSKIVAINTAPTNTPNGLFNWHRFPLCFQQRFLDLQAIDGLPANGGTVTIPTVNMACQPGRSEYNDANKNAAFIVRNINIEIAGEGTSNTVLIACNRSTTILCLGHDLSSYYQCTNFILRDITSKRTLTKLPSTNSGQAIILISTSSTISLANGGVQGSIAVLDGKDSTHSSYNICISNCVFLHGLKSLYPYSLISNIMVVDCQFFPFDTLIAISQER